MVLEMTCKVALKPPPESLVFASFWAERQHLLDGTCHGSHEEQSAASHLRKAYGEQAEGGRYTDWRIVGIVH